MLSQRSDKIVCYFCPYTTTLVQAALILVLQFVAALILIILQFVGAATYYILLQSRPILELCFLLNLFPLVAVIFFDGTPCASIFYIGGKTLTNCQLLRSLYLLLKIIIKIRSKLIVNKSLTNCNRNFWGWPSGWNLSLIHIWRCRRT